MFVIASDVHLDRPGVLEKLRAMFEGFSSLDPLPLFVLIGDFTSKPVGHGRDGVPMLVDHFCQLANLIAEFPNIAAEGRCVHKLRLAECVGTKQASAMSTARDVHEGCSRGVTCDACNVATQAQ